MASLKQLNSAFSDKAVLACQYSVTTANSARVVQMLGSEQLQKQRTELGRPWQNVFSAYTLVIFN